MWHAQHGPGVVVAVDRTQAKPLHVEFENGFHRRFTLVDDNLRATVPPYVSTWSATAARIRDASARPASAEERRGRSAGGLGTSLPPAVEGPTFGFVVVAVDTVSLWRSQPRSMLVRLKWWGQKGSGTLFRPSSQCVAAAASHVRPATPSMDGPNVVRFPFVVEPLVLAQYFEDVGSIRLELLDETKLVHAHAYVNVRDFVPTSEIIHSYFPLVDPKHQCQIGELQLYLEVQCLAPASAAGPSNIARPHDAPLSPSLARGVHPRPAGTCDPLEGTRVDDAIGALLTMLECAGGQVYALVRALDANNDGRISPNGLQRGLAKLGLHFDRPEIDRVMRRFDANHDGQLSTQQMCDCAQRIRWRWRIKAINARAELSASISGRHTGPCAPGGLCGA